MGREASRPSEAPVGRVGGRYRLIRLVAQGGAGRVFEATDETTEAKVAVKLLDLDAADLVTRERFLREAQLLAGLHHPNLVQLLDASPTDARQPYLVLEWLDGNDLGAELAGGPLDPARACAIVRGALAGLGEVHRARILHHDIKPSNVFLRAGAAPPDSVKLLDFGVAKLLEESGARDNGLSRDGLVLGTPHYLSPEQAQGVPTLDARSDLYAFGVILFECLTGAHPFEGSTALGLVLRIAAEEPRRVRDVQPALPDFLDRFVAKALARDPDRRFQTAEEMEEALGRIEQLLDQEDAPTLLNFSLTGLGIARPPLTASVLEDTRPEPPADHQSVVVADLAAVGSHHRLAFAVFQGAVKRRGGHAFPGRGRVAVGSFVAKSPTEAATLAVEAALACVGHDAQTPIQATGVRELRLAVGSGAFAGSVDDEPGAAALDSAVDLLRLADVGEVLTDRATFALVRGGFEGHPRGREATVVVGRRTEAPSSLPVERAPIPFVGRHTELALLIAGLKRSVEQRTAGAALVVGGPGLGKSRLWEELRSSLSKLGLRPNILYGRASAETQAAPLGAFSDVFRRRGSIHGEEDVGLLKAKLSLLVPKGVDPVLRDRALAAVAQLVGAPMPTEGPPTKPVSLSGEELLGSPGLDAQNRVFGERMASAVVAILAAYAEAGPTLIVIDDAHFADLATLRVLVEALDEARSSPLFVLLLARAEIFARHGEGLRRLAAVASLQRRQLEPLDEDSVVEIVEAVLGEEPTEDLLDELMARSGGNPYFIEETLRALVARPELAERTKVVDLARVLGVVPAELAGVVEDRVARLPAEVRDALGKAAVFGMNFWDGALGALGVPHPKLALDALLEEELVEIEDTSHFPRFVEYRFKSAAIRDAAYASLPEAERSGLHAKAAGWIEEHGDPESLAAAEHLLRAGLGEAALGALSAAARRALVNGDGEAALALSSRALDHAPDATAGARFSLCDVKLAAEMSTGRLDQARRTVRLLEGLARPDQRSAVLLAQGELALALGETTSAAELYREALGAAKALGSNPHVALSLLGAGNALADRGESLKASGLYERASPIVKESRVRELEVGWCLSLARLAYAAADLGQAGRLAEQALKMAAGDEADPSLVGRALLRRGAIQLMAGAYERAIQDLEGAERRFLSLSDVSRRSIASAFRSMTRIEAGEAAEGLEELEELLERVRPTGHKVPLLTAGLFACRAMVGLGHPERARPLGIELLEAAGAELGRFFAPLASVVALAEAALADPAAALARSGAAIERLEAERTSEDEDPQALYARHGLILEAAGRAEEARRYFERARRVRDEVAARLPGPFRLGFRNRPLNLLLDARR